MASGVWMAQATHKDPASYIPPANIAIIHNAVLEACDAPRWRQRRRARRSEAVPIRPGSLACKDADGPGCLTAPQVEAARKIYAGPKNPRTGESIYPGLEPGS